MRLTTNCPDEANVFVPVDSQVISILSFFKSAKAIGVNQDGKIEANQTDESMIIIFIIDLLITMTSCI